MMITPASHRTHSWRMDQREHPNSFAEDKGNQGTGNTADVDHGRDIRESIRLLGGTERTRSKVEFIDEGWLGDTRCDETLVKSS